MPNVILQIKKLAAPLCKQLSISAIGDTLEILAHLGCHGTQVAVEI